MIFIWAHLFLFSCEGTKKSSSSEESDVILNFESLKNSYGEEYTTAGFFSYLQELCEDAKSETVDYGDAESKYLQGFLMIKEAEKLEKTSPGQSYAYLQQALEKMRQLQKEFPDWEVTMTKRKVAELKRKLEKAGGDGTSP